MRNAKAPELCLLGGSRFGYPGASAGLLGYLNILASELASGLFKRQAGFSLILVVLLQKDFFNEDKDGVSDLLDDI